MHIVTSRRPMAGLLAQSALGRLADHMAGIIYGWGILQTTGSSAAAGLVIGAHVAVLIAGTMMAGRLIARFGARRVALTGVWLTAVSTTVVALLFMGGAPDPLLVALVGAAGAVLEGPANIASETNYPEVARIGRFDLLQLNAMDDTLDHLGALLGPTAGAAIVVAVGPAGGAGAVALLSLFAAGALTLSLPAFRRVTEAATTGPREVIAFLAADRILLPLTVLFGVVIALFAAIQLVILPRAVMAAGLDPSLIATFLATGAVGSLVGAALTATCGREVGVREVVSAAFATLALGAGLLALGTAPLPMAVAGFVCGLPTGFVAPIAAMLYQSRPPKALRADVQAIAGALVLGATPVTLFAFGLLSDAATAAALLAGIAVVLVVLAGIARAWLPAAATSASADTLSREAC
jgi:hypothetical protein